MAAIDGFLHLQDAAPAEMKAMPAVRERLTASA